MRPSPNPELSFSPVALALAEQPLVSFAPHVVALALAKSEGILGRDREWEAVNDVQNRFLEHLFYPFRDEAE